MKRSRSKNIDADTSGFVIGNMAATTASALGSHLPLIGAATAMGTNKVALDLRNKLIKEVVAGIEQGINQETGKIEKQGDRIGYFLLKGFKDYLDIHSPSGKFEDEMDNVGDGSVKGGKNQGKKLRKAGEKLGQDLFTGFKSTRRSLDYSQLPLPSPQKSKQQVLNLIDAMIVAAEIGGNKLRAKGKELGSKFLEGIEKLSQQRTRHPKDPTLLGNTASADFAIGKMMASSIRGNLKQSNAALKEIEKQTAADEKEAAAITKRIQQRIQQNLRRANSAIRVIDNRVSSQERKLDTDSESFIAKTRSRIFKNQGIGDAPIHQLQSNNQSILNQLKVGIASFQNDLKNIRTGMVNKEAQRTNVAAKDLLANLNVTVTVGKDAGGKIKQAQNAIASLLREQERIVKDIGKLPEAEKKVAASRVERIQAQVKEEQERIAFLKQEQVEAKKVIPVYKQLTKLNQQLEDAIESGNTRNIKKIQNEINKTFRTLNQPPPTPPKNNLFGQIQSQLERIGVTSQNVIRTIKGIAALAIGSILAGGFDQVIRDVADVTVRFEQLETAINFSAGSAEAGAEKWAFIRSEAKRLKVDIETTARAYKNFAASTNNTDLEGKTDRMFSQILQSTRVLQLSKEEMDGTITAFSQIISKGTVQAEELRGQIGERIPGAFQIAARAMGVTTQELGKMLELGQVASNEFLPKFTAQLEKETRLGLADSLKTTGAAIADVQNEWKLLQVAVGEVLTEGAASSLNMVSKLVEGIRGHLDQIIPVLKVAATTVAIALLPTAIALGKFVSKVLITALNQGLSLLITTNTQLMATNAQLTLIATTSPKLAALLGVMTKIQAALRIISAIVKAFVVIEALTTLIDTFNKTASAGESTRDAVNAIKKSYTDLQSEIARRKESLLPDSVEVKKITEENRKALNEQKNWYMKFVDGYIDLDRKVGKLTGLGDIGLMKFDEAEVSRVNAAGKEAIAEAQRVIQEADLNLGFDVSEKSTEDLQTYARAAEDTATSLQVAASQSVDPQIYTELAKEAKEAQKRADLYNTELEKRGDRELTLSKIIRERDGIVKAAQKAETKALSEIDAQLLESGDFKKDVELIKLKATESRLSAELEAEKQALIKLKELATIKGGIDSETGLPKNAQQAKDYEAIETRISELQRSSVENRIAITQKEYEVKITQYDRFLESVEKKRQEAEDLAVTSEKKRAIEIQRLINDGVITNETAEELKGEATRERITKDLQQEKRKLNEISSIVQTDKDLREKQNSAIAESKGKILDLTLELLQQEQQAEEQTIAALTTARDNYYSAIEQRLNSLSELRQQYNELDRDRASNAEKLADLEIAILNRGLEIRRQLNQDDLNPTERSDLIKELNSLGIKGKTSELALLQKIEDREERLAKLKLNTIKQQQEQERVLLDIENDKLELSTIKAYQEAQKAFNDAEQEVVSTEKAISVAETPEELARATELNLLANRSLELANKQVDTTKQQLDDLDSIIAKKRSNLEITQAIAIAELEANNNLESHQRRRDRTGVRTKGELSTSERVEQRIEKAKIKDTEMTPEREETLRRYFLSQERESDRSRENRTSVSKGSSISAPSSILDAIKLNKTFVVPSITDKITPITPLQTHSLSAPKPDNLILNQLKRIEEKLKTPTIVNQENNFTNTYERSDSDRLLRQARSEALEGVVEAIKSIR
jgi:tape measure domain-containing protein